MSARHTAHQTAHCTQCLHEHLCCLQPPCSMFDTCSATLLQVLEQIDAERPDEPEPQPPQAPAAKKAGLFAGLGTVSIKAAVTASLDDTEVSVMAARVMQWCQCCWPGLFDDAHAHTWCFYGLCMLPSSTCMETRQATGAEHATTAPHALHLHHTSFQQLSSKSLSPTCPLSPQLAWPDGPPAVQLHRPLASVTRSPDAC